jgi:hypothetical protein
MMAGTAGRPCCRADRAESRSPPPPPPRPAQRLHAAEKQQVKIKIFLIVTFLKNISHYSGIISKDPSAWDAPAVRRWDHRKVVRMNCQTRRLLEPRPQEPHHRSSPQQPRWTAAKPQPRDRW